MRSPTIRICRRAVGLLALVVALAACSDDSQPGAVDGEADVGARDVRSGDASPLNPDLSGEGDIAVGEMCTEADECQSGLCIRMQAGSVEGVCSSLCENDADCLDGDWECMSTTSRDGQTIDVCLPADLCLDTDGDRYGLGPGCLGPDCAPDDPAINPGANESCDRVDNDCNGDIDDNTIGSGGPCTTDEPGICAAGQLLCRVGELVCDRLRVPSVEVCDGLDNDCDGSTDEAEAGGPITTDCYTGSPETRDVGACQGGIATCTDGRLVSCVGQVLPFNEVCDGLDNDCDGEVDEDNPGAGLDCTTEGEGQCAVGVTACDADGGGLACLPVNEPVDEVCDGLDNDCDGHTDEDDEDQPLTESCYEGSDGTLGVGVCVGGTRTCEGGDFGPCIGDVVPTPEICDGLNNDCDADGADEGDPSGGALCFTGLSGICNVGTTACQGGETVCLPTTEPQDEVCDLQDNDCDGHIDEADDDENAPLAQPCYTGPEDTEDVGLCHGGTQTCVAGEYGSCQDQVLPTTEICDGFDNDCVLGADNGDPGGGRQCTVPGLHGICAVGETACLGGEVTCTQTVFPESSESCDGLDNDCDDLTDEDAQGDPLIRSCYTGVPASTQSHPPCSSGIQTCEDGGWGTCDDQVLPAAEVCDTVDNDCDGTPDDDVLGAGVDCNTGAGGICAEGKLACVDGALDCEPLLEAGDELCDGLDNNCNGEIDEGFTGLDPSTNELRALGETCFDGVGECLRSGRIVCVEGTDMAVCSADPPDTGTTEICDFNDNDCDDETDEDFRDPDTGVYNTAAHCGGCGIDCSDLWPGGPELSNVIPTCAVDGEVASCDHTCASGALDLDEIDENGCEFVPDPKAVYVAEDGVDDGSCGAWNDPCATIEYGIGRVDRPQQNLVRVASGLYDEGVVMVDGISVWGGHNPDTWARNLEVEVSIIAGRVESVAAPDVVSVLVPSVDESTTLSGFTVDAQNADAGGNSIGIWVVESDGDLGQLTIQNNVIFAGRGGVGTDGDSGHSGVNGEDADHGLDRVVQTTCAGGDTLGGGDAGERTCADPDGGGTTPVDGGSGGASSCPVFEVENGAGGDGSGPFGGQGGDGGTGQLGESDATGRQCVIQDGIGPAVAGPEPASGSAPGAGPIDGQGGTAGTALGDVDASGRWHGDDGTDGTHGVHGSGGGGGGAAGGVDATADGDGNFYIAASGGGGGSGGCAGQGGLAGTAGGGSFGILVAFTNGGPNGDSDLPLITGNEITRGKGGAGGDGGNGGAGGDSGIGGAGGLGQGADESNPDFDFCMLEGGSGADGVRGGHGGGGGGGAGGVSFDIYVHLDNTGGYTRDYTVNDFTLDDDVFTGGRRGRGGNSSNRTNGVGEDGANGDSGNFRFVP